MPGTIAVSERAVSTSSRGQAGPIKPGNRGATDTGFRSIIEWGKTGVPVVWVSVKDAPSGLARYERETSVCYVETDTHADVMTCNTRWMRRLEGLGAIPIRIVGYRRSDGQMRYYRVSKTWMRRPYPPTKQPSRYRSADEWKGEGVRVQCTQGDFPKSERETAFSFIETEAKMEINTCERTWQRRLESEGARPGGIQVYDGAAVEFRWYLVPKSWAKLPALRGRR